MWSKILSHKVFSLFFWIFENQWNVWAILYMFEWSFVAQTSANSCNKYSMSDLVLIKMLKIPSDRKKVSDPAFVCAEFMVILIFFS